MKFNTKYEIENACKSWKNKTINEIAPDELISKHRNNKGGLGNLIEELFGLENNNSCSADFSNLNIELKTVPLRELTNKNGTDLIYRPKERMKLTSIDYNKIINLKSNDFSNSIIYQKCKEILLIFYIHNENFGKREIYNYVFYKLDDDSNLEQIKKDYQTIIGKIQNNQINELSGKDTILLEACTSGQNSYDLNKVKYNQASFKRRAFAFKTKQIANILNNLNQTQFKLFIQDLEKKLSPFYNLSIFEINNKLNLAYSESKNFKSKIINAILKTKKYYEFIKKYELNKVIFKNIVLKKNNNIKEHIGLINLDFTELQKNTDFFDSDIYSFTENLIIVFFVWKQENNTEIFKGIYYKNITKEEIDDLEKVYIHTKDIIKSRKIYVVKNGSKNYNFIKPSDKLTFHIRPHDTNSKQNRFKLDENTSLCNFQYWLNKSVLETDHNLLKLVKKV